jgi:C4-dicarboxylate-specific signal transduction histidine kinase
MVRTCSSCSEFSGVAHELNQPLSSIRVYDETIETLAQRPESFTPERILQTMEKIIKQVDRASGVITHMREFASENIDPKPEKLDLREITEHVLELIGRQLSAHGVEFVNDIEPGFIIMANHSRMEQVLINLIGNAKDCLEECPMDHGKIIRASAFSKNGSIVLSLSDTGTGIPARIRNSLFEPFVTTKGPDRGTGLGLSICHGILRDYHASISLAKTDESGTEFHLTFPLTGKDDA